MRTLKLSVIKHVVEVKERESLRGSAYFTIIKNGETIQVYPRVPGWGQKTIAVFYNYKWYVVNGDKSYSGYCTDHGPNASLGSQPKPAAELFQAIGIAIDVNA